MALALTADPASTPAITRRSPIRPTSPARCDDRPSEITPLARRRRKSAGASCRVGAEGSRPPCLAGLRVISRPELSIVGSIERNYLASAEARATSFHRLTPGAPSCPPLWPAANEFPAKRHPAQPPLTLSSSAPLVTAFSPSHILNIKRA